MLCTVSTHDRVCTVSSHPFIIPSIAVPLQGRMHKDLPTRIGQKLLHTQKPKEKKFQKMPLSLADVMVQGTLDHGFFGLDIYLVLVAQFY